MDNVVYSTDSEEHRSLTCENKTPSLISNDMEAMDMQRDLEESWDLFISGHLDLLDQDDSNG